MENRKPGGRLALSYIPSSAIEPVITVKESESLHRAITLMELHDYSQLPVVRGSGNQPKGVVTWESVGRALAMNPDATLRECIDKNPPTFGVNDDLVNAIEKINKTGYALVTGTKGGLSGIVTSADLGTALAQIAQPFMLLEQLEEQLSTIIRKLMARDLVQQAEFPIREAQSSDHAEVAVDDLTLGEKIALATRKETWQQVTVIFDRNAVISSLEGAASLRNRLMHFRPLKEDDSHTLSSLPSLVATLGRISDSMTHK